MDMQRYHVEKLLAKPDQEVALPQPPKEKFIAPPPDIVKNVQGSSSGAGSGEFHVYKHQRKKEAERIKLMDEKTRALEEHAAFVARQAERNAEAEAKTAKNRAKRQKRKHGNNKNSDKDPSGDGMSKGGQVDPKRKLGGGGGGVLFRRQGEEQDDREDEEDGVEDKVEEGEEEMGREQVKVVSEEQTIVIHDDD
ncbi:hypothetical protein TREMEDRAFT_71215 [Tremella mesenterica DSM 1558]|nr:uncharacterized protein TREMEDRAFT_71215 [Tremella mesenterica DSM 1558]EIW71638.1 hypothetical protein TREMEDRAFT_71215 [Tremella mesenterica DSM 1558]